MKRNTTPTIPIKIHTALDNVKRVEFIFADKKQPICNNLLAQNT